MVMVAVHSSKTLTKERGKEGDYILIKREIYQESAAVLNIYTPNTRAPKFIKETLEQLKSPVDPHTLIGGDFSSLREILVLAEVINEVNLTDIFRTLHPNTKEYTFSLVPPRTVLQIDHALEKRKVF